MGCRIALGVIALMVLSPLVCSPFRETLPVLC
jgi:hypothetical protein